MKNLTQAQAKRCAVACKWFQEESCYGMEEKRAMFWWMPLSGGSQGRDALVGELNPHPHHWFPRLWDRLVGLRGNKTLGLRQVNNTGRYEVTLENWTAGAADEVCDAMCAAIEALEGQ